MGTSWSNVLSTLSYTGLGELFELRCRLKIIARVSAWSNMVLELLMIIAKYSIYLYYGLFVNH